MTDEGREFHQLDQWEQRTRSASELAKIEWHSRRGTFGDVVFQLRARAKIFESRALWILSVLLLVVVSGLAFYLYRPILQNENEIERQVHEQTLRLKTSELSKLDARRDKLRDEIAAPVTLVVSTNKSLTSEKRLTDFGFGHDGELVAVGWDGTILTRAHEETAWIEELPLDGVEDDLVAIHFPPNREVVAVGEGGTIITRASKETSWTIAPPVIGWARNGMDVYFGPKGKAVAAGSNGTILTRNPGETTWTKAPLADEVDEDFVDVRFGANGTAVAVGEHGTTLTRAPGETMWTIAPPAIEWEDNRVNIRVGPDGELVAVGRKGTILTRAHGKTTWIKTPQVDGLDEDLIDVHFDPNGNAMAVGRNGTILTRNRGETLWTKAQPADGLEQGLADVRFGPNGELVALGRDDTIFTRAPGEPSWAKSAPLDGGRYNINISFGPDGELAAWRGDRDRTSTILFRAAGETNLSELQVDPSVGSITKIQFDPTGEFIALGDRGGIAELTDKYWQSIQSASTDSELRTARDEMPAEWLDVLRGERLKAIETQREQTQETLRDAEKRIKDADLGTLSRQKQIELFENYMLKCGSHRLQATDVTACANAYNDVIVKAAEKGWWELVAEVVPPAVLLIFLLATLGGLYRYNLRVAGFYHGRADALELHAGSFEREKFEDIVKNLAADQIEFANTKTPIDSVTKIANALIAKMDLRKGD